MNSESSRSHTVISIYIQQIITQEINNSKIISKKQTNVFHVIDLAGYERQTKSHVIDEGVKEACSINKSLLNLSIVIRDIISNKKQIPYRDSKLKHLLRDSIGGNAKTSIIATISPFDFNLSETKSTLNFAQNAKKIKNHAIVNEVIYENENIKEKNISNKYKEIIEENIRLKNELLKYEKSQNNLKCYLKDVDAVDKGIDELVKNFQIAKEINEKLKDNEIENLKANINCLKINIKKNNERK